MYLGQISRHLIVPKENLPAYLAVIIIHFIVLHSLLVFFKVKANFFLNIISQHLKHSFH